MHTILKTDLSISKNFCCSDSYSDIVTNIAIKTIDMIKRDDCFSPNEKIIAIKKILPESFLQCRIVTMNYEVFKNIYKQRKNHKLPEWQEFCKQLLEQLPEYTHNWIIKKKEKYNENTRNND